MLDQGEHPTGHEPGRSHHHAAARHLVDLHHASPGDHLDPAAGPGGGDLVGLRVVATRVDDDLDPVTLHRCPRISGGQGYGRSGSYLSSAPRASPANLRFRIGCRGGKAGAGSRREGRGRLAEGRQGPARGGKAGAGSRREGRGRLAEGRQGPARGAKAGAGSRREGRGRLAEGRQGPARAAPACARYSNVRADQRELRCSMASGTPKHLERFSSVNTRPSRPVASTEPRRISIAWVNPAGTSSTWWVTITRVGAVPSVASRAIRRTKSSRPPRSRPAAGSSRNSSSGSGISARAIWTRLRSPSDSVPNLRRIRCAQPIASRSSTARVTSVES